MQLKKNDVVWLFYIPLLYRKKSDFLKIKKFTSKKNFKSLCTFKKTKNQDHPYYCWGYNQKKKKLFQYIKNDFYRRQDLPNSYMHYHYICCFKIKELNKLNSELINQNTQPIIMRDELTNKLIEIDTKHDLQKYELIQKNKKIYEK